MANDDGAAKPPVQKLGALGSGDLSGFVYDFDGAAIPDYRLGFAPSPGPSGRPFDFARAVVTSEQGFYQVEGLPSGAWDVHALGESAPEGACGPWIGSVSVHPDGSVRHDFVLPGKRILSGTVTVPDQPLITLDLELRFANAPERVAARGSTLADLEQLDREWEAKQGLEPSDPQGMDWGGEGEDPGDRSRSRLPPRGWFAFEGLAAEAYVLRVGVGTLGDGEPLFVERQVDLTLRDHTEFELSVTLEQAILEHVQKHE